MNRAHALILAVLFVVTAAGVQPAAGAMSLPDGGHQLANRHHGSAPDSGDTRWSPPVPQAVTPR